MPNPVKVQITDKTSVKDWKRVFGSDKASVKIGVLGPNAESKPEGSKISVAEIAAIHEFGLGGMPERSFLRSYFDANMADLLDKTKKLMARVISAAVHSGKALPEGTQRQILATIGEYAKAKIQERIANNEIKPPTSEKTNARKGSSVTLIDSGQLRSSVSYEVDLEGKNNG